MSVRKMGGTSYSNAYPYRRKRTHKKDRKVEEDATVEISQSEEKSSSEQDESFSTYDQHGRRGKRRVA